MLSLKRTTSVDLNTSRPLKDASKHLRWDVTIYHTSKRYEDASVDPMRFRVEHCSHDSLTAWIDSIYSATSITIPMQNKPRAEHIIPVKMLQDIFIAKVHPECNIDPCNLPQLPFHVEVLEGELEGEIMIATEENNSTYTTTLGRRHKIGTTIRPPHYQVSLTSEKTNHIRQVPLQKLKLILYGPKLMPG